MRGQGAQLTTAYMRMTSPWINGTLYELASQWEVNDCGLIPVAQSKLIVPNTVHDVASHTGAV